MSGKLDACRIRPQYDRSGRRANGSFSGQNKGQTRPALRARLAYHYVRFPPKAAIAGVFGRDRSHRRCFQDGRMCGNRERVK